MTDYEETLERAIRRYGEDSPEVRRLRADPEHYDEHESARIMGERDGRYGLSNWAHLLRPEARPVYVAAYEAARSEASKVDQ